jgi:hypothetical protein
LSQHCVGDATANLVTYRVTIEELLLC